MMQEVHFVQIGGGVIRQRMQLPHVQHVITSGQVTKPHLLRSFAAEYGREDLTIRDLDALTVVDRTLTAGPARNAAQWAAAGHEDPPTADEVMRYAAIRHGGAVPR
jgi:hypothetical protein